MFWAPQGGGRGLWFGDKGHGGAVWGAESIAPLCSLLGTPPGGKAGFFPLECSSCQRPTRSLTLTGEEGGQENSVLFAPH